MTVSITKGQLIEKLEHRIEVTKNYPDLPEAQLDAVILNIALKALTAEPVAWRYRTTDINGNPRQGWSFSEEASLMGLYQPLYTAPPAPVVPKEVSRCLAFFASVIKSGEPWTETCQRDYDSACAAMLQAEPVTTANKLGDSPEQRGSRCGTKGAPALDSSSKNAESRCGNSPVIPDTWIPVSERLPEEGGRYWCYVEEQNSLGKSYYQWNCSWNGEIWGGAMMYGRVTHWMPLPAAPQEVK